MEFGPLANFLTSLPTDWIIIGSFGLVLVIDALRVGVGRIATLALAAVLALVVMNAVPDAAFLGFVSEKLSTPVLQAVLFGAVLFFIFLLVRRVFIDYGEENGRPIQALVAALAVTALLLVVWVQVPALEAVWHFGEQVQTVFGAAYRFWWMLVGISALAFSKA